MRKEIAVLAMPKRVVCILTLTLSAGAMGIGGWTEALAKAPCLIAAPAGTLNVRAAANGVIIGTLTNDTSVTIVDESGSKWVYVEGYEDQKPIGWVYRDYIDCDERYGPLDYQAPSHRKPH